MLMRSPSFEYRPRLSPTHLIRAPKASSNSSFFGVSPPTVRPSDSNWGCAGGSNSGSGSATAATEYQLHQLDLVAVLGRLHVQRTTNALRKDPLQRRHVCSRSRRDLDHALVFHVNLRVLTFRVVRDTPFQEIAVSVVQPANCVRSLSRDS